MRIISHSKPTLGKEEERAAIQAIKSGQISQGQKVAQFEKEMAEYIGKKYSVAVSSGLSALHLSLLVLGVKKGDEVILPSYTCEALLDAVLYIGAKPKIVDVDYKEANVSAEQIKKAVNKKTKVIIVPHNFGFPAKIDSIMRIGLPVIEDCAVSIGARYKNKMLGFFGLISVFSFSATKMLTTGEGGMILTNDRKIADKVRDLRDYTKKLDFKVRYNYKMSDIEASIGIAQLKKLPGFIKKRLILVKEYQRLLKDVPDVVLLDYNNKESKPVFYRYIVELTKHSSDKIRRKMAVKGIICGYGVLNPLHKLLNLSNKKYPNSQNLSKRIISLPIYPLLNKRDIKLIAKEFIKCLK